MGGVNYRALTGEILVFWISVVRKIYVFDFEHVPINLYVLTGNCFTGMYCAFFFFSQR